MTRAPNPVFANRPTTIFEVMSRLAAEHGAINLGQGFPDEDGPEDIRACAGEALRQGPNQYPPMMGTPELRRAVADCNRRFYGLEVDWARQVLVTSGATEALGACLLGLLEPGDEAVLIEPYYDCYPPMVEAARAIPKFIPLKAPDYRVTRAALESAFSERTKLIVVNTPLNPMGRVLSDDELGLIAEFVEKYDAYAVCDEVYEHIIFDGLKHRPLMTFPGMADRALRIGSAGKTFSLTGWKVGYVTGPEDLVTAVAKTHQYLTFTTPPALQAAVAYGLAKPDAYYHGLAADMQAKRDLFAPALREIGFDVLPAQGTYFITCDAAPLGYESDAEFCRDIIENAGVAAVPISAFYHPGSEEKPETLVRFCFCKQESVLNAAAEKLAQYFAGRPR